MSHCRHPTCPCALSLSHLEAHLTSRQGQMAMARGSARRSDSDPRLVVTSSRFVVPSGSSCVLSHPAASRCHPINNRDHASASPSPLNLLLFQGQSTEDISSAIASSISIQPSRVHQQPAHVSFWRQNDHGGSTTRPPSPRLLADAVPRCQFKPRD